MISVTVDKVTYRASVAKLYVSDYGGNFGEYNHPELSITMAHPENEYHNVNVVVKFQRHNGANEASGVLDTARCWSHCYNGSVELRYQGQVELIDRSHTPRVEAKVRIAVARKIARVISKHNLYLTSRCQCLQTLRALDDLRVSVEKTYHGTGAGESYYTIRDLPGAGANKRAREAGQEGSSVH